MGPLNSSVITSAKFDKIEPVTVTDNEFLSMFIETPK